MRLTIPKEQTNHMKFCLPYNSSLIFYSKTVFPTGIVTVLSSHFSGPQLVIQESRFHPGCPGDIESSLGLATPIAQTILTGV